MVRDLCKQPLSHLKNSCKRSPLYKKSSGSNNQATLSFKPNKTEDGGSLAKHSFSQERGRLSLARMCIKDNKPFSVVDDEGFREYLWELNPQFKLYDINTKHVLMVFTLRIKLP